jgi:Spy/CpxP family protein refolding chaperone
MTEQTPVAKPCCQAKCCSCCGWKKKLAITIAVILIALLGFMAGRATSYPRYMRMHHGMMGGDIRKDFMEFSMNKLLDSLDATPEQRAKMAAKLKEAK